MEVVLQIITGVILVTVIGAWFIVMNQIKKQIHGGKENEKA
jgi:uncharacterized protein YneF (UPF0154 family)